MAIMAIYGAEPDTEKPAEGEAEIKAVEAIKEDPEEEKKMADID